MHVLFIPCGKMPEVREIDGSLASMQELVGGLIEDVCWGDENIALICNDEGLLLGLPPNRSIRWKHIDNYTVIHGDFFLCGVDGEKYTSLPQKLIEFYAECFRYPEIFLYDGEGGILSLILRFHHEEKNE